ncbi:MAG: 6-phosphofructokinase [Actinomycetota bacterium]
MTSMRRIAVLTSGGDAPGMNAAVWAIIKLAASRGIHVTGIEGGYDGLIDGRLQDLTREMDDAGIAPVTGLDWLAGTGGTFLGSSRSVRFRDAAGRGEACDSMSRAGIDALIVVGGNGSLTGAHLLAGECNIPIVGIPASIDNDIGGSTDAIGVDTALNTIIEACDRVSDTARSHHRAFVLEVMGRESGYLAMTSAVAATADAVLLPEQPRDPEEILDELEQLLRHSFSTDRGKRRVLIIKAEGVPTPTLLLADQLQNRVEDLDNVTVRAIVLGHLVRGGHPSFHDRMIAGRLALGALTALAEGSTDVMAAWQSNIGVVTQDPQVSIVSLAEMLTETERLLDGTSEVTQMRLNLIREVQGVLAL